MIVGAAGVLVAAVLTSHPQWAWISVGLSVAGAVLLVIGRGRRRSPDAGRTGEDGDASTEDDEALRGTSGGGSDDEDEPAVPAEPHRDESAEAQQPDGDPAEEDTDAADALAVSELDTTVVVLDEHPRYHLEECPWLGDGETIPLPVREARDLGFTPCSTCTPDAVLAARNRPLG